MRILFVLVNAGLILLMACSAEKSLAPEKYIEKAANLVKQEKYNRSLVVLEKAHKTYPNNLDILVSIGATYFFLKNYDLSLKYCDEVLKKNPKHFSCLLLLADNYIELKKFTEAEKYLKIVDEKYPTDLTTIRYYEKIEIYKHRK